MSRSDAIIDYTPDQYGQVHPHETPDLIARKLIDFDKEVKKLKSAEAKGIKDAQLNCPDLLTDKFKLMFLRAEVFNADLAAQRYGKYWNKRIAAFGRDKAFLPMTLTGALSDPADQVAMATGCVEIVENCTDKMGRGAMIIDSGRLSNPAISTDSIIRTIYYMAEAALTDHEDVQKYGGIIFGRPPSGGMSDFSMVSSRVKKVVKYCVGTIPFRLSAYHIVQPPYFLRPIISMAMLFLKDSTKKRLRCHTGTNEQLLAELEADGLSRETLPEYVGGNAKFDMAGWIEERRAAGL